MPSLPRSPFGRRSARAHAAAAAARAAERDEPRVEIVEAAGLRWINIVRPRAVDQAWLEQPVEFLFERCRTDEGLRESIFSNGAGYLLYKIVDDCVDASFPMLRKMGNKLERLEEDIFEGRSAEIVRDLSNVKQEIINFRKIVRPQRVALRDLERTRRYVPEDLEIYFDDIIDASERIWDMLENFKEVVEALEDTNESVLAHEPAAARGEPQAHTQRRRPRHATGQPRDDAGAPRAWLRREVEAEGSS